VLNSATCGLCEIYGHSERQPHRPTEEEVKRGRDERQIALLREVNARGEKITPEAVGYVAKRVELEDQLAAVKKAQEDEQATNPDYSPAKRIG
jgi:hypothetical protein